MNKLNTLLHTYYFQIIDIWNRLCEEHTELFELTCQEYGELLENNLEKLEEYLDLKEKTIFKINALDSMRSDVISKIGEKIGQKIESVGDLFEVMQEFENYNNQKHLWRFNQLLVDIIEKIQTQNKKNQLFINKASKALQEIKDEVMGHKTYSTYNSHGMAKNKSINSISQEPSMEE